jgi:MtN3 and saliva related transmembrane protein
VVAEALGWISSFILILTIGKQVYKQWKDGTSEGVSKWLFLGQITASIGFLIYSVLITNWVFIVTNSVMVLNSLVGLGLLFYHKRRDSESDSEQETPDARASARA